MVIRYINTLKRLLLGIGEGRELKAGITTLIKIICYGENNLHFFATFIKISSILA